MRKLLFNFWNTDEKKMYRDFEFEDIVARGGFTDNGVWIQWTGLLDKNKVRIYEGDIVERTKDLIKGKIEYNRIEGRFVICVPKLFRNYNLGLEADIIVEVIGNIYENPELIKI